MKLDELRGQFRRVPKDKKAPTEVVPMPIGVDPFPHLPGGPMRVPGHKCRSCGSIVCDGTCNTVFVHEPILVEDGKLSFWMVYMGVTQKMNTKILNKVLKRDGFNLFDRKFSTPHKKRRGLRMNHVSSVFGTERVLGETLKRTLVAALVDNGFDVGTWPGPAIKP